MNKIPYVIYKTKTLTISDLENIANNTPTTFLQMLDFLTCPSCGVKLLFVNQSSHPKRSSYVRIPSRSKHNHQQTCTYFENAVRQGSSGTSGTRPLTIEEVREKFKDFKHQLETSKKPRNKRKDPKKKVARIPGKGDGTGVKAGTPGSNPTGIVDGGKTPRVSRLVDNADFDQNKLGAMINILDYIDYIDVTQNAENRTIIYLKSGKQLVTHPEFNRSLGFDIKTWADMANQFNTASKMLDIEIVSYVMIEQTTQGDIVGGLYDYQYVELRVIENKKRIFKGGQIAIAHNFLSTHVI